MKVLTLTQPWASLVIHGLKSLETRSWGTQYRGWLAIHAAKGFPGYARDICDTFPFDEAMKLMELTTDTLPRGVILGEARLITCGRISGPPDDAREAAFGDYTPGRFMWAFDTVYCYPEPVPARGALGLWEWDRTQK